MGQPTLSIIGAGKVGRALARLWQAGGILQVQDILNRSVASGAEAAAFIGAGKACANVHSLRPAELWLIATPDDAIADAAAMLAATGVLNESSIVFHCSGARTSADLSAAAAQGAATASMHPIRSFADPAQVAASFAGTYCGMEGHERALNTLTPLFTAIGALPVPIAAEHKTLYHAAAVFACNYLVTLQDVALAAYEQAGIPRETGLKMLEPLVRETVENVFTKGPAAALTGPVARGDHATVTRQEAALRAWDGETGDAYAQLARLTMRLKARIKARSGES